MRPSIIAGQFYEDDFTKLNQQLELAFEQGPGSTPLEKREGNTIAAIIPHSQFKSSAKCASWAYKELGESPQPFTYVILGAHHKNNLDKILISLEDFSTPFGIVKNDRNLANKLLDSTTIVDEPSHAEEHSIELQLPFIQFINRRSLDTLRILPIIVSTFDLKKIKTLAEKLSQVNNLIIIASSDLIHYGPLYNFTPFKYNIEEELENLTNNILDKILNLQTETFLQIVEKNKATICGASSIAVLLEILKKRNIKKGKLLCHYSNSKDDENSIDFASIIYNEIKDKQ
ncbi:AmmeMemoRadiSam system protein B [archaeon]|nr:AmmeMemoRadiSam system protein B [archaeon]|tara:strand:+ start:786 stop:1646 length:861 start_codon:yes stop_codon:yes gene_type:complete